MGAADGLKLHKAGTCHHARWMMKAIYSLKIYALRKYFNLPKYEIDNFRKVCKFVVFVYLKAWFQAPLPIYAPNNDFQFSKELVKYKNIDKSIFKVAVKKFKSHLWYLSPELCAMAFFDNNVSNDMKRKMVQALKIDPVEYEDFEYHNEYQSR